MKLSSKIKFSIFTVAFSWAGVLVYWWQYGKFLFQPMSSGQVSWLPSALLTPAAPLLSIYVFFAGIDELQSWIIPIPVLVVVVLGVVSFKKLGSNWGNIFFFLSVVLWFGLGVVATQALIADSV